MSGRQAAHGKPVAPEAVDTLTATPSDCVSQRHVNPQPLASFMAILGGDR